MIKDISELFKKNKKYIKQYFKSCTISEKIAAYYFHVKILSSTQINFYKSNHKEIETTDIILNKMWLDLILDISKAFLSNLEFMKKYIGYTFSFFYLPVSKPFNIQYKDNFKYILSNVEDSKKQDNSLILNDFAAYLHDNILNKISVNSVLLSDSLRSDIQNINVSNIINQFANNKIDLKTTLNQILKLIISENHIHSIEYPEGFILRNNGEIYQIKNLLQKNEIINQDNRLTLEFFTHVFSDYLEKYDYVKNLNSNYIKSVCNLFLDFKQTYWIDFDLPSKFKYYNVNAVDLESPNSGYYPGTCFDLIPNKKVREICSKSSLDDNMFKILLNGLRKHKKQSFDSLLMNQKNIDNWNECVDIIHKMTYTFNQ